MQRTNKCIFGPNGYQAPSVERIDIKAEKGFAMSASSSLLPWLGYEEEEDEF